PLPTSSRHLSRRFEDPEFRQKFLSVVPRELERINSIVEGLLELARPAPLTFKPLRLPALLERVLELYGDRLEAQSVRVARDWRRDVPVVWADQEALYRALVNLVTNALDAMPRGGTLRLRVGWSDAETLGALRRDLDDARARIAALERELAEARPLGSLGRMTASIAHDFRNVMAAIAGQNQLLLEGVPADSQTRRRAEAIRKATGWGERLARELLAAGRPQPPEPAVADLNAVVLGLVRTLQPLLGEDIEVRTELEPKVGAVALGPAALEQIAMNLILNARDAMPSGGRVTVCTALAAHAAAGPTVLVVEEEAGVRELIVEILELHGFRALPASDHGEAERLSRAYGGPLALVIAAADPGTDAARRLDLLRRARPETRVL